MFKNLVLPVCLSFGSGGGPSFKTSVSVTEGGYESRNQLWEYERLEYECRYDNTVALFFEHMHKFFRIMQGRAHTFLAIDPLDYIALAGEGVFVDVEGVSPTVKQMAKMVTIDSFSAYTLVTKPKQGYVTLTGGTGSIDYDTGIVTGSATGWVGEYYKHVRFDTDVIKPRLVNKKMNSDDDDDYIVAWDPLPIIEVRGE